MEIYEKEPVSLYLSGLTLLENVTSQVQQVQVYQHPILGKVLVIDHEIQNVEKWAPLYHEAIVHVPMLFIEQPKSVLILGGGDLYAAETVLQYPTVERVILNDYDSEVIRLTELYYPHAKAVLNDPRLTIVYQDAKEYIRNTQDQYDLIIDDCFNLVGDFSPEEHIFKHLYDHLTQDRGVCSSLIYRHIFDELTLKRTAEVLFSQYDTVLSMVTVPEYPGVLHLLSMWGKSKFISQDLLNSKNHWHIERLKNNQSCGQFFDPKYCGFYLYLPRYIKDLFL